MEIIIPQIFHVIKIVLQSVAVQFKQKKHILICFIFVNIFAAIGYILLKAYSGLIVCVIAILQTIIQYLYDKKKKETPKIIIVFYFVFAILGGIFTYKTIIDILPILSFIAYVLSIIQKNESNVRKYTLVKLILWIPYDLYNLAVVSCVGRIVTIISTIISMLRLDHKKNS